MAPDLDPATYDHAEMARYGLGKIRPLEQFYKLFLINRMERIATKLCPFVRSGTMHRDFQKHLRPDGLGIDYTKLENYDTSEAMKNLKWHG